MYISKGVAVWLIVSSIIVILDAFFILSRPLAFPGGPYYWFYFPYELYYQHDSLYGPKVDDHFVVIIAWLNLLEVALTFLGLAVYSKECSRAKIKGAMICLVASVFIFWKTVIYMWYDVAYLSEEALNFSPDSLLLYYLPNSLWILFPIWSIGSIGGRLGKQIFKAKGKQ